MKNGNYFQKRVQVGDYILFDERGYSEPLLGEVTVIRPISFDVRVKVGYTVRCIWDSVLEYYTPKSHPEYFL